MRRSCRLGPAGTRPSRPARWRPARRRWRRRRAAGSRYAPGRGRFLHTQGPGSRWGHGEVTVPTRCCIRATHCSCTRVTEDSTVWRPGPGPRLRGAEVRQVALVHRPVVVEHEVEVGEGGGLHRGQVAVVAVRVLAQPPAEEPSWVGTELAERSWQMVINNSP